MKKAILLIAVCLLVVFGVASYSHGQLKSYYSGDAINFNGDLYVGSTNTDSLEIFKLEGQNLRSLAKVRPFDARLSAYGKFYDLKFIADNGHLYIYTISDFALYKYELVGDQLSLITSQKNTYWEWYNHVDKFGDNLITTSDKGVKIWNSDLQVINGYAIGSIDNPYNVRSYNDTNILNVQGNYLTVYSRANRSNLLSIPVNYKKASDSHLTYQDENGNLYIVDDYYAKKFSPTGELLGSFKHLDYPGYDIAASGSDNFIYFTNGIGVVRLNKDTMKEAGYAFTNNANGPRGWAMGLKVVNADGDKVVVFNNANILVLDANLKKVAAFQATDLADETSTESLVLNLDHVIGSVNSVVVLKGAGYFPNEKLSIDFGGVKSEAQADNHGRFTTNLTIPNLKPSAVDIKVVGVSSQLSYSIAFKVQ